MKKRYGESNILVAGSDINGHDSNGQFRYLAIVIGTKTAINTLFNKIGLKTVEMKKLKKHQRKHVKKHLDFSDYGLFAISLKVDKQKLMNYFTSHPHSKAKFMDKKEVHRYFDTAVFSLIRNRIDGFCQHHGTRITKLQFQCDPDMTKTIKHWKLSTTTEDRAYEFADAISYCFEFKWTPIKGCKYLDCTEQITKQLRKCFMK